MQATCQLPQYLMDMQSDSTEKSTYILRQPTLLSLFLNLTLNVAGNRSGLVLCIWNFKGSNLSFMTIPRAPPPKANAEIII